MRGDRLGPRRDVVFGPSESDPSIEDVISHAKSVLNKIKENAMHYRNGREAKNGDIIIQLPISGDKAGQPLALGVLYDATPGNDYCNGSIAQIQQSVVGACMCDCLHVEDLAAILKENGLDKRPEGK